jgi:tetratricopeptide (TPR) repeat protein
MERCSEWIAFTGWNRHGLAQAASKMQDKPPFTNQLNYDQQRRLRRNELKELEWKGTSRTALEEAYRRYTAALVRLPEDLAIRENFAHLLQQRGNHEDAVRQWQLLLDRFPNLPQWREALAKLLLLAGNFEEGTAQYREAVQLNPRLASPMHCNIGVSLIRRGKSAQAMEHFRQALEFDENSAFAHHNLASALAQRGEFPEAIQHYRRAVEIDPNDLMAGCLLGDALAITGKAAEAIERYREVLKRDPEFVYALDKLARILSTHASPEVRDGLEAVRVAKQACAITSYKAPVLLNTLASAYAETGQFRRAMDTAGKALQIARAQRRQDLVGEIQNRLLLYEQGKPFHVGARASQR